MANNSPLSYTGVTRNDIRTQINAKLANDPIYSNLSESAIVKIMSDIFIDSTDLIMYYLERRAEECYLDTAKLRSSIILLARQMGYVVNRPMPAVANISIILKDTSTLVAGDKIRIPQRTVFSYSGDKYVLLQSYIKTLTDDDIALGQIAADLNGDSIVIVQGEIKDKIIYGADNVQVSQPFQTYRISDPTFSNFYGSSDTINPLTKVIVGQTPDSGVSYIIDRRSIINWESIHSFTDENPAICLIRTAKDDTIDLMFGDNNYSKIGAASTSDNIYISYLSTKGYSGNKTGIIGRELTFAGQVQNQNGNDITDQIQFYFNSNCGGGADIESSDSIKVNAPEIYYSLERLVTRKDYAAYLRSLTSPIDVRNAVVWGENEEAKLRNVSAIKDLFNIVFFSCIGSLYNLDGAVYAPRTVSTNLLQSVLDLDFDEYVFAANSYYSIYYNSPIPSSAAAQIAGTIKQWEDANTYPPYKIFDNGLGITYDTYESITSATTIGYSVSYSSINPNLKPNVVGTSTGTFTFSTTATSPTTRVQLFASRLQASLRSILDTRIDPNVSAFAGITVSGTYTSGIVQFEIAGNAYDNCVILSLTDNEEKFDFSTYIIPNSHYVYPTSGGNISKGIVDVVNILNDRSLITTRNIYMSPIIQGFDITGDVIINNYNDIEEITTLINNMIYTWADIKADFNVNIFKSDIYNIINTAGGVISSYISFTPSLPDKPKGQDSYWVGATDERLPQYSSTGLTTAVYNAIHTILSATLTSLAEYTSIDETRSVYGEVVYTDKTTLHNGCTERYFYDNIVSKIVYQIYELFKTHNRVDSYYTYIRSSNFRGIIADIHKDFMWIIKTNMINTNGDIAKDPVLGNSMGGFSLGNEIVKLTSKLNFKYASN